MTVAFRILLAILVFSASLSSMGMTVAQEATPSSGDDIYIDPAGRFSVPIPTNWTVIESDDYITLVDPDDELKVHAVVIESADTQQAIVDAWVRVDPEFDADAVPLDVQEVPSSQGIDETVVVTYDIGQTSGRVEQGFGQRVGETVYVLIFIGSLDAAVKRNSQITIIASGFTILSIDATDLGSVEPLSLEGAVLEEFVAFIEDLLVQLEVPGASVAVVQNGKVVFIQGFGVKEIGLDDPVTPSTRMMIGSTSKSMTTMMMATEVDDGLMDWDTPVQEILPEFTVADDELSATMTMQNLVCACTGVPRRDLELIFNARELSAEDVIESLADFEFFTDFGEAFQYSNQMVATGGYAAAAAAGGEWGSLYVAFDDEIQERVFDPIGMTDTTLSIEEVATSGDYAVPHGANLSGAYEPLPLNAEAVLLPVAPAGAVWSTAEDMSRYLITLMSGGIAPDGDRVVSEKNLAETWLPQVAVDAETDYGLGWFIEDYKGVKIINHGGNTMGFTSDLAFLPDAGIGIVVLANGQASNLFNEGVRARLFELLFDQPNETQEIVDFALEQGNLTLEGMQSLIDEIAYEDVGPLLGVYENPLLGEMEISTTGNVLYFDAGEFRSSLRAYRDPNEPDQPKLIAWDPPIAGSLIEVSIGEDGYPVFALDMSTDVYEFTRIEGTGLPVEAFEATAAD